LGNSSHEVAANIDEACGYLIYRILGVDPDMNLYEVIIDPGNGKLMFSCFHRINVANDGMGNMMNPNILALLD